MLAKGWQKFLMFILIIACIWNIFVKFSKIISFDETILSIKSSIQRQK